MNVRRLVLVPVAALAAAGGWWGVRHLAASPEEGLPPAAVSLAPTMSGVENIERGIRFHRERAERDPYSASDRAALAGLYLQRSREGGGFDDYRTAEKYARESIALRTTRNAKAFRMLSASLLAQHRFEEALEVARELVRVWPEDSAHRALLAELQMEMGDYEAARATIGSLQPDRSSLSVAPRLARWAEASGRIGEEREILYAAAERATYRADLPREQVAWFYLRVGEHEIRNGRFREAEKALREGLRVEPGDFRLVSSLARLEAHRGNWREAIRYGEMVGEDADLRTLAALGDAHAELGDAARAEEYYRKVEESAAENPEPFNRQWTQFRLDHGRKLPETLALLQDEIRTRKDVLGYDMLAWALYRSGRHAEAARAVEQALRMGTRDATLHFHAGMIYRALGQGERARKHLETALGINPRFHPTLYREARGALESLD